MTEVKDAAMSFEAVKMSFSQDKEGYVLKLRIHPNDVPEDMFRDWVGSRYMAVLVKVDEEGEPVMPPEKAKADKTLKMAHALCRNEKFWKYLGEVAVDPDLVDPPDDPDQAAAVLRDYLGITSRSELKTNKEARERFLGMAGEFESNIQGVKK